jgi:hypothetical protein
LRLLSLFSSCCALEYDLRTLAAHCEVDAAAVSALQARVPGGELPQALCAQ